MKKYQRMHLILLDNTSNKLWNTRWICGWCAGSFFDSRLESLVSQCPLSTHPLARRLDLSRDCLYLWIFLDSQGTGPSLFDNLWALGQRLVRKGEFDKYLTRPINPLFHILVETFQIDALGELLVGGILLATTVSSIAWTLPKFLLFLVCIPFATLIYTSLKIATASIAFWTKQSGAMIYIFYMLMTLLSIRFPFTIRFFVG